MDCTAGIKLIDDELAEVAGRQSSMSEMAKMTNCESVSLRKMLSKLLMRRGLVNCQAGAFIEALSDFTRSYNLLFASESEEEVVRTSEVAQRFYERSCLTIN